MSTFDLIFWTALAFFSGALPFSVWVGRLVLRTDIRQYGDHNPGASNVMRAGSKFWGFIAILLDGFKGAIPIWMAIGWGHVSGWPLAIVAIAPVLGHAYSPFLGFRGGKAIQETHVEFPDFEWKGEQPFKVRVENNALSIEVGPQKVFDQQALPNYEPGSIMLGTYDTRYGPRAVRLVTLRGRALPAANQ